MSYTIIFQDCKFKFDDDREFGLVYKKMNVRNSWIKRNIHEQKEKE